MECGFDGAWAFTYVHSTLAALGTKGKCICMVVMMISAHNLSMGCFPNASAWFQRVFPGTQTQHYPGLRSCFRGGGGGSFGALVIEQRKVQQ